MLAYAEDLLQLLKRCRSGLKEDGLVIIKENVCEQGFVVDPVRSFAPVSKVLTTNKPLSSDLLMESAPVSCEMLWEMRSFNCMTVYH